MKIFADRLKKARGTASQAAFSKAAGISRAALANYEADIREPDLATFRSIAEAAGVSADWLLGMTNDSATDRGGVTNTATASGDGAQAAAGGTIQNGDPATSEILRRLAALEAKVAASSTPPRKRR